MNRANLKRIPFKLHRQCIGFFHRQDSAPDRAEVFPREDGLGAGGTILLADDAWPIHCPGQAPAAIDEGRSQYNGTGRGIFVPPEFFIQAYGADCRRWADLSAGDAIELATACTDAEVQDWRPKAFQTPFHARGLNDICRADAHALAAPEATSQKVFLGQRSGRPNHTGMPVWTSLAGQTERGNSHCA